MTLREALSALPEPGHPLGRFVPPPAAMPAVAARLAARYRDDDRWRKSPRELAGLLQRLRLVRFEWARVTAADRRDVAQVLWTGPTAPAEHPAFLTAYLDWLETPWRRVQASRAAATWAMAFDPDAPGVSTVGTWLAAHAPLLLDPWPRLAAEFDLFSPAEGPRRIAAAMLEVAEPSAAFAAGLGLREADGLLLETLAAAAGLVAAQPGQPRRTARLLELARHCSEPRPDPRCRPNPARLQAIRCRLAEALLLPWRRVPPPGETQAAITDHLLRQCGDPRLATTDWRGIDPAAVALFSAWLRQRTLAVFYRLAARRRGSDPQLLQARHQFWIPYLDHIDDAWLAVGSQGAATLAAERIGGGRLIGCRADDCALVLRIGGMTVVETGHGGEAIWLGGNALTPVLDHHPEHAYLLASLTTGADFSSGYHGSEAGTWQQRLHDFIAHRTGITPRPGA